jgi:hypothetical protein
MDNQFSERTAKGNAFLLFIYLHVFIFDESQ